MIFVDNARSCPAIVHFAVQGQLEECGVPKSFLPVFDGARGSEFHSFSNKKMTVWIGLGKEETLTLTHVKSALALAAKTMRKLKQERYQIDASAIIRLFGIDSVYDMTSGVILGLYEYEGHRSTPKETYSYTAYLQGFEDPYQEEIQQVVNKSAVLCKHILRARDWVNLPGNLLKPDALRDNIIEAGQQAGCETKVVSIEEAQALHMNLFLGVGLSSDSPCSIAVLRYLGNPDDPEVTAFVGKGVTMDTGGYSLKNKNGMNTMKSDMGGAAAVTAAVCALAENHAKANVIAVVPIVENRLSNTACTPGDVLTGMNGKTVEILSTDAEGRLILADALTYAVQVEKADRVIDVATLTGAIVQAYGKVRAGVMTNDDLFEDELLRAASRAGEKFVDLPTDEEYFELIEGTITDLLNSSRNGCGSIAAGLFLREFCEGRPWMHLDIAGTAWSDKPAREYESAGATGSPAATLYFLMDRHFTAADRF